VRSQAIDGFQPERDQRELREAHSPCAFPAFRRGHAAGEDYRLFHDALGRHLSDAAESVIHVIAVAFASFSLRLSLKPASHHFLYGTSASPSFSAGFEGALIVVAAIAILVESIREWIAGLQLQHLGSGVVLILIAGILNAALATTSSAPASARILSSLRPTASTC